MIDETIKVSKIRPAEAVKDVWIHFSGIPIGVKPLFVIMSELA